MTLSDCDISELQDELFLSTDLMDSKTREALWRDAIQLFYHDKPAEEERTAGASNTPQSHIIDTLLIGTSSFHEQKSERTASSVAQGGFNHYVLHVIISGTIHGDFNGSDVFAKPGDILIFDLSQIVSSKNEAGTRITVIIPRHELEKLVGWRELHGTVLKAETATTKLIFDYLSGLKNLTEKLSPTEQLAVKNALLLLVASSINTLDDNNKIGATGLAMRSRILGYIDDHISNPNLSPSSIQSRFRVSRSHLYRAFEADGGVAKIIRDKRLDHAYRIISDHKGKPISLKEIAYLCGFNTGTQFAKAFKARFDVAPKDVKDLTTDSIMSRSDALTLHNRLALRASLVNSPNKSQNKSGLSATHKPLRTKRSSR